MSHEIETNAITGKAEIAFRGNVPWHGLGQTLTADATIDQWAEEAGLAWGTAFAPVQFKPENGDLVNVDKRFVIYRNDTNAPLGVVSNRYNAHTPRDILDFMNTLMQKAGFTMEVAGCLRGGRRIWALANVNKEYCLLDQDLIKGYLLLSTSFDGTTATNAQFTDIRVVCNNTIQAADNEIAPTRVTLTHGKSFDERHMHDRLGIMVDGFWNIIERYKNLAAKDVNHKYVDQFLTNIFPKVPKQVVTESGVTTMYVDSRAYKKVLDLFNGKGAGSDLATARGTRWGLLNAITEFIDHDRGHNADTRLNNAWFGNGTRLKQQALEMLEA